MSVTPREGAIRLVRAVAVTSVILGCRTRRCWKPNNQKKRLYSEALDDWVKFDVTTAALRLIDRAGGVDNYMLATKDSELGCPKLRLIKDRIATASI
jgi:large subunit ribosomal protein L28